MLVDINCEPDRAGLVCLMPTLQPWSMRAAVAWLWVLWLAFGCLEVGGAPNPAVGEGPDPPIVSPCVAAAGRHSIDEVQQRFVLEIYPLMTRSTGGCVQCHADDSGRLLRMTQPGPSEAAATFLRMRGGGWLNRAPGSMVFRIEDNSMPQGGPAWTRSEKDLLAQLACDLSAVDGGVDTPLDEQFPPELTLPYDGPAITDYDNTFLTFNQLRGRVSEVFHDEWVRLGVDEFSTNIALFGGVDFIATFVPGRAATPEFLAGLDILAQDVCQRAAADGTGPMVGLDLNGAIFTEPPPVTTTFQAEGPDVLYSGLGCPPLAGATSVNLCTASSIVAQVTLPTSGEYRFSLRVAPQPNPSGQPIVEVRVDGLLVGDEEVPGAADVFTTVQMVGRIEGGEHSVSVAFTNDSIVGGDRNLVVDFFTIDGPLAGTTDGSATGEASARDRIKLIAERVLQRSFDLADAADAADVDGLYGVLLSLDRFETGQHARAFAGVCEALLQHPDWLFARPPTFDGLDDDDPLRSRFLVMQSALLLLDRVPTADELGRFDVGELDRGDLVDLWLSSAQHRAAYQQRVREILEFDGTPDGDEPARLWGFIAAGDRPLREVLTADYTVDEAGLLTARPDFHGQTGVLTMKGYIRGKPGLPHYNYAARVLTGFMGTLFDVPQAALDARATATASSTVDPQSICFSCHRLLTPLAHQRQKWDDEGNFREAFDDGRVIDDSDHDLVADYPFRGVGLEAFSLVAVHKEQFARRMANAHFLFAFGRLMRHDLDEREVYHDIYDAIDRGDGHFHDVLRAVLFSKSFTNPPRPIAAAAGAP